MTRTDAGLPDELPQSAWVLGWASLISEVATLAERGGTNAESAVLSVPLTALVVWWVSRGVLRARMVRTWFAGILLGLVALLSVVGLFADTSVFDVVTAITAIVAFAAFWSYTQSTCFARIREQPDRTVPDLGGILMLAIFVGALGGLTAPVAHQGPGLHVRIGL